MTRKAGGQPPLRVLHLVSAFEGEGQASRAVAFMNRFAKGIAHAVVSADPAQRGAAAGLSKAVTVSYPFGFPALTGPFKIGRLQMLARAMQGFDLILTYGGAALDAAMAHALFGPGLGLAPLVHHAAAEDREVQGRLRNWYRMVALSRASGLVVPDGQVEDTALRLWRQPRGKVHLVPDGVDVAAFSIKPRPDSLPRVVKRAGELWLGVFAGSGQPVDGLMDLVRILPALPDEWHLVIAGDIAGRNALQAEAVQLNVGHLLHMPGAVPDRSKVAGLFDLAVVPAGAPQAERAVREAMAAGLAIVAVGGNDLAELTGDANAAHIVPPENPVALPGALIDLVNNAAARRQMGSANRKRAKAMFDRSVMADRLGALYGAVLGRPMLP